MRRPFKTFESVDERKAESATRRGSRERDARLTLGRVGVVYLVVRRHDSSDVGLNSSKERVTGEEDEIVSDGEVKSTRRKERTNR